MEMEKTISSDSDNSSTMLASQTFDKILQIIQKSNLNFVMQVSPFSASISLKKSLITDKSGAFCLPPESNSDQISQEAFKAMKDENTKLESALLNIKSELVTVTDDCEAAYARIKIFEENRKTMEILEQKVAKAELDTLKVFNEKKNEVDAFKKQIKPLNDEINERKKEITSLKKIIKERDRDLQKINGKYEKLETTTKRFKLEIASLKTDDKKRVKCEALQHRKKTSNQPISSSIESESSSSVSTENNASENTSFTPKSPLNNNNRQIIFLHHTLLLVHHQPLLHWIMHLHQFLKHQKLYNTRQKQMRRKLTLRESKKLDVWKNYWKQSKMQNLSVMMMKMMITAM